MIQVNDKQITVLAAPLQGVTDNVWRMAQHEVFGGVDAYYAPFMRVEHGEVRRKDLRDVDPERNVGTTLIPQILDSVTFNFLTIKHQPTFDLSTNNK